MPLHEYLCEACGHEYEELVFGDEQPTCPRCESERSERKLSAFARPATDARAREAPPGCGTCGDPRGPGACSL